MGFLEMGFAKTAETNEMNEDEKQKEDKLNQI
jgi:hypothetical protein